MFFKPGWYVIYTKSRHEKKVASKLLAQNIPTYLPVVKTITKWSDRIKKVEKPLFHSYVFVYLNTDKEYYKILDTTGVVCFIKFKNQLAQVRDVEINAIKNFLKQFSDIEIGNSINFAIGEKRKITCGVFKDFECEILKINRKKKICVRIESIKMSLIATFHPSYLE